MRKDDKPTDTVQKTSHGYFAKGNTLAKKRNNEELSKAKCLREYTKTEIIRCAASLANPYKDLKKELEDPTASKLQYVTNKAVAEMKIDWLKWLLEQAVGKASQRVEHELKGNNEIVLKYNIDNHQI